VRPAVALLTQQEAVIGIRRRAPTGPRHNFMDMRPLPMPFGEIVRDEGPAVRALAAFALDHDQAAGLAGFRLGPIGPRLDLCARFWLGKCPHMTSFGRGISTP
jgi:hypothetical protein